MSSTSKPIIFLAFANDRQDDDRYLRNLPEELRSVEKRLEKAVKADLCELVIKTNTTIDELLDVFQEHRGRIALFHFGGHAGGFQLLLETAAGSPAFAHAEGLAEFLGNQQGLQLVFLNGCSTEPQVEGLLNSGIPAVIATSQSIDDQVATALSIRFYNALSGGASLDTAFTDAVTAVKTQYGESARSRDGRNRMRNFVVPEAKELIGKWPWELYIGEGADKVRGWNLPLVAGDPFFGLPPLPAQDLPESPYRNLQWFRKEDASIFFGRGREIRNLYHFVTDRSAKPIVLFYGQSGVGKSSVLHAGLFPRLEGNCEVRYIRRNRERGLAGTLADVLGAQSEQGVAKAWHALEKEKPLVVILDQVEELYTRPGNAEEMERFIGVLKQLFADRYARPTGKLILAFRKEWLADIDDCLKQQALPRSEFFLKRLDRDGVMEVVNGPTNDEALQRAYKLDVEDKLPEIIAGDLLEDRDAPVSTTLSILLTKMWSLSRKLNREAPAFTIKRYQQLKLQGLLLDDFLNEQLKSLNTDAPDERWRSDVVESGLALDVLAFHTTPLGTAESRTKEELERVYAHREDDLRTLIRRCEDLYLLVRATESDETGKDITTIRLVHDTLAPLIRQLHKNSDAPGQRAQRILENRVRDWKGGEKGRLLDITDLRTLNAGEAGMHAWNEDERHMVKVSRKAHIFRKTSISISILVALIISGVVYQALTKYDACKGALDGGVWCKLCIDADGEYVSSDASCKGDTFISFGLDENFIEIFPTNSFYMGSENGGDAEKPVHEVTLSRPYHIGKTEVTQAQWYGVMRSNQKSVNRGANLPVDRVSWNDVQIFLDSLNMREGCDECYRLPTEAEWEYAARGGTTTEFSFGNEPDSMKYYGWTKENATGTTHPVGELRPNSLGLYDMHGNVWEWVQDGFGSYPDSSVVDPIETDLDSLRVTRGGSWSGPASVASSAFRGKNIPDHLYRNNGFRLVKNP